MNPNDEFNLFDLIRDVYAKASDLNIQKIAVEVDQRIKPEHRDAALRQALPRIVSLLGNKSRRHTAIRAQDSTVTDLNRRSARSPKVAGIREHWRAALLEVHSVNRVGDLKRLADLNRADLLFNIHAREDAARRSQAKAVQFRGLLDLVTRHDVDKVGDLPESVLAATLVRAA